MKKLIGRLCLFARYVTGPCDVCDGTGKVILKNKEFDCPCCGGKATLNNKCEWHIGRIIGNFQDECVVVKLDNKYEHLNINKKDIILFDELKVLVSTNNCSECIYFHKNECLLNIKDKSKCVSGIKQLSEEEKIKYFQIPENRTTEKILSKVEINKFNSEL